jgi:outer membrane protein assembly factor BamD
MLEPKLATPLTVTVLAFVIGLFVKVDKLLTIKSYYRFAENSFVDKQKERFEKVVEEYNDFVDRFSDSPLLPEAKKMKQQTDNFLKNIK